MNAESRSLRILYVEDHADTAVVFARLLEEHGYSVQVAPDSAAALAVASRNYFDLLLCDIVLPDEDGCELLLKLQERPHLRTLCAIAFTALGTAHDQNKIKAAGFDGHVLKPVVIDELIRQIQGICHSRGPDALDGRLFTASRIAI